MHTIRYNLILLTSLLLLTTHLYGNNFEALAQAIMDEDLVKVKKIISKNPELVNSRNRVDDSPLSIAAECPRLLLKKPKQMFEMVKYLVEQGADYDSIDLQKRTPLFKTISANHAEAIIYLVNLSKRNINLREEYYRTLYYDSSNEWSVLSPFPDRIWVIGNNPLEASMRTCDLETVQYLIKKGAQAHEDKIAYGLDNSDSSDSEVEENAQFVLQFLSQKKDYLENPTSFSPELLPMILEHLCSLRTQDKDFEWVVGQHYASGKIDKLKATIEQQCDEDMRSPMLNSLETAELACVVRFKKLHDINFKFK